MSELTYQIFGSKSSRDYDVLLNVNDLKSIDSNHKLIKEWNDILEQRFVDAGFQHKKVNCNLGVINAGHVIQVFKGTYDEVNNSLFFTYNLHKQIHHKMILSPYDRTTSDFFKHLKLKRCYRFLLSFYSRTDLRTEIKAAMKGDFNLRLDTLSRIDFLKYKEFPNKKDAVEDIYKVIAFQLAQTLLLFANIEIFTKEQVINYYPELSNFILRLPITDDDLKILNKLLDKLIVLGIQERSKMVNLQEEIFENNN